MTLHPIMRLWTWRRRRRHEAWADARRRDWAATMAGLASGEYYFEGSIYSADDPGPAGVRKVRYYLSETGPDVHAKVPEGAYFHGPEGVTQMSAEPDG